MFILFNVKKNHGKQSQMKKLILEICKDEYFPEFKKIVICSASLLI